MKNIRIFREGSSQEPQKMSHIADESYTSAPIDDNTVYAINPRKRLRNEDNFIIAYDILIGEQIDFLSDTAGLLLSFFDGKRTVAQIADLFIQIVNASSDASGRVRNYINRVIGKYSKYAIGVDPILVDVAALLPTDRSRIESYEPKDFVVNGSSPINDLKMKYPTIFFFFLTEKCQTDCVYCYSHRRRVDPGNQLPFQRWKEIIDEGYAMGVRTIHLIGGDPLCHPSIMDLFEYFQQRNISTTLSTKAYVSKDMAKRIKEFSIISEWQFGIDSSTSSVADMLVRKKGYFSGIVASIQNMVNAGIETINAKSVVTPYNIKTIPDTYRFLRNMGLKDVRLAAYSRSIYCHKDDFFNCGDDFKWLEEELQKLADEFGEEKITVQNSPLEDDPANRYRYTEAEWNDRSLCTAGKSEMTILPDGKLVACEQMPQDEEHFLGDLATQSVIEVWNSERFNLLTFRMPRDKFKGTACYECEIFDDCHNGKGYCLRDAIRCYGSMYAPDPRCPKASFGKRLV